jgi:hypothetical protein
MNRIIIIIILLIIIYIYSINNIRFLSKDELNYILKNDKDNFYSSFNSNDFKIRKIKSIEEYKNIIENSVSEFTEIEKEKIKKIIHKTNNILKNINYEYFDGNIASKLDWNIGCTKNDKYEYGYPHTRNNIIIISRNDINKLSEKKLMEVFIHEKVHIYQKMYPEKVNIFLKKRNFKKFKLKLYSNPDTDNYIYKYNNNLYGESLKNEHPYEVMAYEIDKLIK